MGLPPAQQPVSEYETAFQMVVKSQSAATSIRPRHVFVIVILATWVAHRIRFVRDLAPLRAADRS